MQERQAEKAALAQESPEITEEKVALAQESPEIIVEQELTRATKPERKRPFETSTKRKRGNHMRVAIVTGASTGMGREFVKQIWKENSRIEEIWVIARSKGKLMTLQAELGFHGIKVLSLDLTKEEDIAEYRKRLEAEKPEVCILVNSAGYGKMGTFEEVGYEHNRGMIKTNCQSLVDVTYLTLPYMKRGCQIINLASSAAFLPQPEFAIYAASKSFVLSFSRALRLELKERGITVTAVCPGPVKTEFFQVAEADGGKKPKPYKMLFRSNAKKVVKKARKDAAKGKEMSVYGLWMKLFSILCKVVPHRWILALIS